MNAVKYFLLALLLAVLSGCATTYPISDHLRQQSRQITIDQVRADPEGTRGSVVIWGGRIVNVVARTNGTTFYIFCLPLPDDLKPVADQPSPGNFIAISPHFMDPQTMPYGSLITVAGPLDGIRTETSQNSQYPFPVVIIQEMHVWPAQPGDYYPSSSGYSGYSGYYPYSSYYYYPSWYGNYWGPWPYWGWGWGGGVYYYGGFHGGFHGNSSGSFHGNSGSFQGGEIHGGESGGGGSFHGSEGGGGSFHGGGGGGGGGGHH